MSDETLEKPFRKRRGWMIAGVAVIALSAALWAFRAPIADNLVEQQLDQRDIPARYTIDRIGLTTQRLSNVSLGDPRRPDLTARWVEVDIGYRWSGPYVSGLRADGVRLYGEIVDGALTLGVLDRFRDPTSTDPFSLPDIFVDLTDARARIGTPWGDLGARLEGRGNLRRDFDGRLAMVAPAIAASGCTARDISFYGQLAIRNVEPQLDGPLRATSLSCADGSVTAASPQIGLKLALREDLKRWRGKADASVSRLTASGFLADRVGILASFAGTAAQTDLTVEADIQQLQGPEFSARTVAVAAKASVGAKPAALDGTIRVAKVVASSRLRQQIAASASATVDTPLGPIATALTKAVASALADIGGEARFLLTGADRTRRLELVAPQFAAGSGARIIGSEESRVALLLAADRPAFIAQGRWQFSGGGLPDGSLQLDRQADGSLSGEARIAPYTSAGARLTLSPVQFSGDRSGLMRFATVATLSGPLGDGRVDDLSLPVKGVLAPTGALALAGGCTPVSLGRALVSGVRLDATRLNLCSQAGRPLLALDGNGVRGLVSIPGPAIKGSVGASPLLLRAAHGQIDLATMRWGISSAEVRVGTPGSATEFSVAALDGRSTPKGLAGTLTGANGHIGTVPLNLGDMGGSWTWQNGVLALDGALVLTDTAADARFQPLVSQDAKLRLVDGVISATAGFSEREKGQPVVDVVIEHQLKGSSGFADLNVRNLRFNDQFQPDDLTRLALGVVANVEGSVVGQGRIDWTAAGVTSSGTFATAGTNLAAAFGPVTGATTTITFDDLIGLHTLPGQKIALDAINPGFPVVGGTVDYQLLGNNQVRIEGGRWPFAGGELTLHPTTLDFNADQVRRLRFDLTGVDAAAFLQQFGFENINATGIFDGTIPVVIDGLGSRIENGRLDVRTGGGTLAYVGTLTNENLGVFANFAFNALKSLRYDDLTIVLNGDLDGEMVTDIRFGGVGQGEGASQNFITKQIARLPLIFNVKISAPFRQLITSAKGFYDPSLLVEQNLPALIQAQEARRLRDETPSVQPSESEPVP